jgi:FAD synthetase
MSRKILQSANLNNVSKDPDILDLFDSRLSSMITESPCLQKAIEVIDCALVKYCVTSQNCDGELCFNLDKIIVAFNGGKDCTLILYLIVSRIRRIRTTRGSLRLMYLREPQGETFQEVQDFVEKTKAFFGLPSIEVDDGDMRAGLEQIVRAHPEVQAIFMGTRSTDPNAGWMHHFCQTSPGWPQVDLVAPILHMTYSDLWNIIHKLDIEVCSLYTKGYTSIGCVSNTTPNPSLRTDDGKYLHADQLKDGKLERLGRVQLP